MPIMAAVVSIALAVVLLAGLWAVRDVLVLVYACVTLALGLGPLVRWIERRPWLAIAGRRPPRWSVVLVLFLFAFAVLGAAMVIIVPPLVAQARALVAHAPDLTKRGQVFLDAHGLGQIQLAALFPAWMGQGGSDALGTVFGTLTSLLGGIFGMMTIVILTFYLLIEGEALFARWLRLLAPVRRVPARAFADRVTTKVSAWLLGQLILCATIGTAAGIAVALLGVPFAYVLAIVAAVGELIPYVGPLVAGTSAVTLAALTVSWNVALAAGSVFLVLQLLENNLLQPKLMSRQVGLSAVTIIVAVLLGGALLGVAGVILAVPTAAIVEATIEVLGSDEAT
jgi:predicted PurR-regulated permease PerM